MNKNILFQIKKNQVAIKGRCISVICTLRFVQSAGSCCVEGSCVEEGVFQSKLFTTAAGARWFKVYSDNCLCFITISVQSDITQQFKCFTLIARKDVEFLRCLYCRGFFLLHFMQQKESIPHIVGQIAKLRENQNWTYKAQIGTGSFSWEI